MVPIVPCQYVPKAGRGQSKSAALCSASIKVTVSSVAPVTLKAVPPNKNNTQLGRSMAVISRMSASTGVVEIRSDRTNISQMDKRLKRNREVSEFAIVGKATIEN